MRTRVTKKPVVVAGAAAAVAAGLVLGGAGAADAHVTIAEGSVVAGTYEILTVSVPHGCEGSATTEIAIQIPEGINAITPTRNALYSVEKVMEDLETPITDSHGNEVTERVAQVVYTADSPLPDGLRDDFELSLRIPDDAAGSTLYFPIVQTCEQGEAAWVQIPEEGQAADELDAPAPSVEVVAAAPDSSPAQAADTAMTAETGTTDAGGGDDRSAGNDQTPLVIASLAIGAGGLVLAAVALLRGRNKA